MFAEHQPLIAQHATTPQGFADVVTFVIASQNQHFYRVGDVLQDLRENGLDGARYLTKIQRRGIAYAHIHAEDYVRALNQMPTNVERLKYVLEIPHIGIVKAGFILQLTRGESGCLDRHNLKALGLAPRTFARTSVSTEALTRRLQLYLATCESLGTPAQLWDAWCKLIALKYPRQFVDAEDVSRCHVLWCRATPNREF